MRIFPKFFFFSSCLKEWRSYGKKIFNEWLKLTAPPTKTVKRKNHGRILDFRQNFSAFLEKLHLCAVFSWKKWEKTPKNPGK